MVRFYDRAGAEIAARERARRRPGEPFCVCLRTSCRTGAWRAYSRVQYRRAMHTIPACLVVVWDKEGGFREYESWAVYPKEKEKSDESQ